MIIAAVLDDNGVSRHLRRYYLQSGWIEPLGGCAYKKPGYLFEWQAGVNVLQDQLNIKVYEEGLAALILHGVSHYFRLSKETINRFFPLLSRMLKWFTNCNWNVGLFLKPTLFFLENTGAQIIIEANTCK